MIQGTALTMSFKLFFKSKKTQTELTEVKAVDVMIVYGVRTVIPCFRFVFSKLNSMDGFKFSGFLMGKK